MTKDYTDYRKWVEEECWQDQYYFQEHEEYQSKDLVDIFTSLLGKAEGKGLENCYLKFQSHMEPYEDWLGNPSVVACGYRQLNTREKESLEREDKIAKLAKEKGITEYQARNLQDLIEAGVLPSKV